MKAPKTYKQPQPNPAPTGIVQDKPKTSGIKIRGTGAATKGIKARGPMA